MEKLRNLQVHMMSCITWLSVKLFLTGYRTMKLTTSRLTLTRLSVMVGGSHFSCAPMKLFNVNIDVFVIKVIKKYGKEII
ncbi:hypothetical protein IC007_0151 [Sulfuracidifex tepidarius]|uniref:Uncharacterized protein n=1 Tax=Sulfuracidifex tepidarius TaxID=1294262 RepID=A0A510DZG8_9CREN|nr:hypothetical protein IC007_0151 [Sulfuracidifex tepidarius]